MHPLNAKFCNENGKRKEYRNILRNSALLFMVTALILTLSAAPGAAWNEKTFHFRSVEDPSLFDPVVCAGAPFYSNVHLGASLWSYESRASDGMVVNDDVRQIGTASACVFITSLAPSATAPFYIKYNFDEGASYTAQGTCTVISNDVPTPGLVIAGCNLKLTEVPTDAVGGAVTSLSIFNPRNLPGFGTGSFWTLRVYSS